MADRIYFDIETIPDQTPGAVDEFAKTLEPPANYKKEETIAKWREENAEKAWRKTSLDGAFGEICCIGMAADDSEPISILSTAVTGERGLLSETFKILDELVGKSDFCFDCQWIGFDVHRFDLSFIWKRCIIRGLKPPSWFPRQYSDKVYDAHKEWCGRFGHDKISLDSLCRALKIKTPKGDIDGSKVWDYWKEGKHEEVAEYCRRDVEAVRQIYKRMNFIV